MIHTAYMYNVDLFRTELEVLYSKVAVQSSYSTFNTYCTQCTL